MDRTEEGQEAQDALVGEAWPYLLDIAHSGRSHSPATPYRFPLWNLYAPIAQGNDGRPFVVGQLGQSLDGRIATVSGDSRYISGREGIRHLHRLRALVDAVVVGVGTIIADDPQLTVREAYGPSPARVVIDPNFRLPPAARIIQEGNPIYVVQGKVGPRPPGVEPIVIPSGSGPVWAHDIVVALADRGFSRILVEGGAATVSAFLAAGALHRFHLSISPVIIGAGPVGLNLPPIDQLGEALRPPTTTYRLEDDILFDCALAPPP